MAFEEKTPTVRNSEGLPFGCRKTANHSDNVDIRALIAFSKSGTLKLSCIWFLFSANLKSSFSELPKHNLKIYQHWQAGSDNGQS